MENRLNHARLISSLEELGRVGVGADGKRIRLALGDADRQGRDLLCRLIGEAGLELKIDAIGNIFGVLPGTEGGDPVTAGSHIDTVPEAGMFDGCVGVLGGLEALRSIAEKNIPRRRPLAVVAWTNEEGARFLPGLMGSLVSEGRLRIEDAYAIADADGLTVGDELRRIGYSGADSVRPSAYLELHVEQGPYLDAKGIDIGVVTGITGLKRWEVKLTGEANHAGTTPMNMRRDPLLAVSKLHVAMSREAEEAGAVFTIGRVEAFPGAMNVVPGEAAFTIDLRSQDRTTLDALAASCVARIERLAADGGLKASCVMTDDAEPVKFAPAMVERVERSARARGLTNVRMGSGAGHDAQILALRVPTAMIFVPSIGGRSHCPEELSDMNMVCEGAEILADCLLDLANE